MYPNITHQLTDNANLDIDPQESAIAELEASPFSRVCRVYAPIYHEDSGKSSGEGPYQVAIDSVEAAWTDYIEHYNHGRGFVLIGHSEGTGLLGQLIINRIEHNPTVRQRLVSAVLTGGNLPVRTNGQLLFKDQQIQPCRSDDQTGCVIGYDSFSCSSTAPLEVRSPAKPNFWADIPSRPSARIQPHCREAPGALECLYLSPAPDSAGSREARRMESWDPMHRPR